MLLLLNAGIFYEFIEADTFFSENPKRISLKDVQLGVNYVLIVSTNAGLWGYNMGDTVMFTSLKPYRIVATGRIKHFISAFGEHVIAKEVEEALAETLAQQGGEVSEFTVAPQVNPPAGELPYHEWLIEFEEPPRDLATFTSDLDTALRALNSDYDAKRYEDMTLLPLTVDVAPKGLFHRWLESEGKLGGQHKVPRLSNSRHYLEALLALVTPSSSEL